jgi:hypothetical protein
MREPYYTFKTTYEVLNTTDNEQLIKVLAGQQWEITAWPKEQFRHARPYSSEAIF